MKYFVNNMSLTEPQFMAKYSSTDLYTPEYLKAYYAWLHRDGKWQTVVEEFTKTKACADQYPDLYKKHNTNIVAPPT